MNMQEEAPRARQIDITPITFCRKAEASRTQHQYLRPLQVETSEIQGEMGFGGSR